MPSPHRSTVSTRARANPAAEAEAAAAGGSETFPDPSPVDETTAYSKRRGLGQCPGVDMRNFYFLTILSRISLV